MYQISCKSEHFLFLDQIGPKMTGVNDFKKWKLRHPIQHVLFDRCAKFHVNQSTFLFLDQIGPKMTGVNDFKK